MIRIFLSKYQHLNLYLAFSKDSLLIPEKRTNIFYFSRVISIFMEHLMNTNEEVQKLMSNNIGHVLSKLSHLIVKNTNYVNIISNQLKEYSKHKLDLIRENYVKCFLKTIERFGLFEFDTHLEIYTNILNYENNQQ